jgi:hypothetical protein
MDGMTSPFHIKMQVLQKKLKARTRPDGSARPGFEQNVAVLRAEMAIVNDMIESSKENKA